MATALKQLKEMEERVKGVPALEKELATLRAEKDMLLLALEEKKAAIEIAHQKRQSTETSTQTTETLQTGHSQLTSPTTTAHKGLVKSAELKRLTEKFEGKEQKSTQPSPKVLVNTPEKVVIQKKSVAVGDDLPMTSVVFYHCHGVKDASVGTEVNVCEKCTATEAPLVHEQEIQVRVETAEADVWVIESLLGLSTDAQREIDTLQDTIKFQQESIVALEDRLSVTSQDLGILQAQIDEKNSTVMIEKGVLAKPDMKIAQVETVASTLKHAAVLCRPEVSDASVGIDIAADPTEQGTQTDVIEAEPVPAPAEVVSVGCQCESLSEEKTEEEKVTVPKKKQLSVVEYKVSAGEEVVSGVEKKEEGQGEEAAVSNTKTGEHLVLSFQNFRFGAPKIKVRKKTL